MSVLLIMFGIMILLMVLNVPIALCTAFASFGGILAIGDFPMKLFVQRMFIGFDSFTYIAIPLFILTGSLMAMGGVTNDLLKFSKVLVGFMRGGLAYVNIVSSMIFAGITGSAASDTASIGSILIPAMVDKGYDKDFSVAVTATSSVIGVIIPPSIPMVMYGVAANASIGKLFLGGIIPGIMTGFALMAVTWYYARKRNYPVDERFSVQEALRIVIRAIPAVMTLVIIIGGILGGIVTPTEAAGVAAFYAMLLGVFYYKEIRFSQVPGMMLDVAVTTGMVALMVGSASCFGYLFTRLNVPQMIAQMILSVTESKIVILLLINLLLLFVGTWLDMASAILIFTPILVPIVTELGIDLVHFGVILTVNLGIGLFTPPVGVCLFVSCGIAKISIADTVKAFIPFFVSMVLVLIIITYVPQVVMFLPNMLMQ
ncbi:MAG: TRAP transporter large permease [Eubacteriales bacterium]|jgi:tripartite ATP-independent transporter DctM subunit